MPDIPLPITFRAELIELIAQAVAAGESCALVGVGSSGKSNVVRFLRDRSDAREHYFGAGARRLLWLLVDCNALEAYDERSLMQAMLEALVAAATRRSDLGALRATLEGLLAETPAPGSAYRALHRAIEAIQMAGDFMCAFVLDDCDQLVATAPGALLRRLRALRDDFKYKLIYVTVTRRELVDLRPHSAEFETFYELLVVRSFAVGPYSEADARFMLDRLAARLPEPTALDPRAARKLIAATGGHGGLLKAAFFVTQAGQEALAPGLDEMLSATPSLIDECAKIWDSLEKRDREGLAATTAGSGLSDEMRLPLLAKGLVHERVDGSHVIFCPVFDSFVRRKAGLPVRTAAAPQAAGPAREPRLEIYQGSRLVRIDRQDVSMTRSEFELLCRLYERRGQECRREDLLERILQAETVEPSRLGRTVDEALDRAAQELAHKLEAYGFARPSIVIGESGGYMMTAPQV